MSLARWFSRSKTPKRTTNRFRRSPLSWDWLLEDRCLPSSAGPFPIPAATTSDLSQVFFIADYTGNLHPAKTITIHNDSSQTIYPFLRDTNTGSESTATGGTVYYDPEDPRDQDYRAYIGYENSQGTKYLGLPAGSSITIEVPFVFWNGANIYYATDGANIVPASGAANPYEYTASSTRFVTDSGPWVVSFTSPTSDITKGVVMFYHSTTPTTAPSDSAAQVGEFTIRDPYLAAFGITSAQAQNQFDYSVSYAPSAVLPVAMEATAVAVPNTSPTVTADYGWVGTTQAESTAQSAVEVNADDTNSLTTVVGGIAGLPNKSPWSPTMPWGQEVAMAQILSSSIVGGPNVIKLQDNTVFSQISAGLGSGAVGAYVSGPGIPAGTQITSQSEAGGLNFVLGAGEFVLSTSEAVPTNGQWVQLIFSGTQGADSSVFSDNFDRADSTNLGSNWITVNGTMGIRGDEAAGISGIVDQAQVNGFSLTDTAVSVVTSLSSSGSSYAGVFARRDSSGNMYAAMLVEGGGTSTVNLYRYTPGLAGTNGGWSVLKSLVLPTFTTSAELELQVTGSGPLTSLQLYVNNALTLSWTEGDAVVSGVASYPLDGPGGAGVLSIGKGTAYQDFGLFSLVPQPVFADNFERANSTSLGSNWSTVEGTMGISGDEAAGLSGDVDQAQVNGYSLADTAVSAVASLGSTSGGFAGVFARRNASGDMYVAMLVDGSDSSPDTVELYRYTPGLTGTNSGWSILASQAIPTGVTSAYLELKVTGSALETSLQVYVNNALALSWTEGESVLSGVADYPLNGPGGAGLLSIGTGNTFQQFSLSSLLPQQLPASTPSSNPNANFVNYLYESLLGRAADSGSSYWVGLLDSGTAPSAVVEAIEASTEYLDDVVKDLYEQYLQRAADPEGLNAWVSLLQNGGTIEQVISGLVSSPEYYNLEGGTNSTFVASLYTKILGRSGSPTEVQTWVNAMAGGETAAQVANAFLASQEYRTDLVESYYEAYLGRPADATGLADWLSQLGQGVPDQIVLASILGSTEGFQDAASAVFTDSFDRPDSSNLGSNWSTILGTMGVNGDEAAGLSGSVDQAQVNGVTLSDTAVSTLASIDTTGTSYAGVFARRDTSGNMYVAILEESNTPTPASTVYLERYTPGLAGTNSGWSVLQSKVLPTVITSADLKLQVTGSGEQTSLQLYLNDALTLTWTEGDPVVSGVSDHPLDGPGGAGLLSINAGTTYKDFNVFSPLPLVGSGNSNPNATYVGYLYEALLGRLPDAGAQYWVNLLNQGATPSTVVQDLEATTEYLDDLVNNLYEQYLKRAADSAGLNAWVSLLQNGGTIEQVISGLVSSSEYYNLEGGTNTTFVESLYTNILGRAGSSAEVQGWVNAMAGGMTAAQVAGAFLSSQEYETDLAESYYETYLGRPADPAGLATWVGELNQGVPDQVVLAAILGSPEDYASHS